MMVTPANMKDITFVRVIAGERRSQHGWIWGTIKSRTDKGIYKTIVRFYPVHTFVYQKLETFEDFNFNQCELLWLTNLEEISADQARLLGLISDRPGIGRMARPGPLEVQHQGGPSPSGL